MSRKKKLFASDALFPVERARVGIFFVVGMCLYFNNTVLYSQIMANWRAIILIWKSQSARLLETHFETNNFIFIQYKYSYVLQATFLQSMERQHYEYVIYVAFVRRWLGNPVIAKIRNAGIKCKVMLNYERVQYERKKSKSAVFWTRSRNVFWNFDAFKRCIYRATLPLPRYQLGSYHPPNVVRVIPNLRVILTRRRIFVRVIRIPWN